MSISQDSLPRSGASLAASVVASGITVSDNKFVVTGSADATKTLKFECDAQSAGADMTIDTGAQTADRTVNVPALAGAATFIVTEVGLNDNAVIRADGTAGKAQNSGVIIDDSNNVSGVASVTASGKALVGATALDADLTSPFGTPYVASIGSGNSAYHFVALSNVNSSVGAAFIGAHTRSTGTDANTTVQNNDQLAVFGAWGADGAAFRIAAAISMEVDGTPGSGDMPGRMVFYTTPDGTASLAESARISNAGNWAFASGKTITAPAGIIFANETFSTYDEGTFTPTIFGSGTAGTPTYTVQVGRYIRAGNKVSCEVYVAISAKTGIAGNVRIGGLPFTIKNTSNYNASSSVGEYGGITFAAGRTQLTPSGGGNTTYIGLTCCGSAVAVVNITDADIAASTYVIIAIEYEI